MADRQFLFKRLAALPGSVRQVEYFALSALVGITILVGGHLIRLQINHWTAALNDVFQGLSSR